MRRADDESRPAGGARRERRGPGPKPSTPTIQMASMGRTTATMAVIAIAASPRRCAHRPPTTIIPTVATVDMASRPRPIRNAGAVWNGVLSTIRATTQTRAAAWALAARSGIFTRRSLPAERSKP